MCQVSPQYRCRKILTLPVSVDGLPVQEYPWPTDWRAAYPAHGAPEMTVIHFDTWPDDDTRRERLYQGDIFVYEPTSETLEFKDFARSMIEDAFGTLEPETAQYELPVEEYASLLGELKPRFIHHPDSKAHIQKILSRFGCDTAMTFFEVPKLRSSTSDDYLTAGIAYAWHPHRDTWYSAPQCQINWWMPIYDILPGNCMAFHAAYWDKSIENSSKGYNYYEWNRKYRGQKVTQYINSDPRPLPKPLGPLAADDDHRIIVPPGGLILFSAAHLHSSVANATGRTRFSVDFRTVSSIDLVRRRGAPNLDSACTGTVLREFRSARDLSEVPDDLVCLYEDGTESVGPATFAAPA